MNRNPHEKNAVVGNRYPLVSTENGQATCGKPRAQIDQPEDNLSALTVGISDHERAYLTWQDDGGNNLD